MKNNFNIAFLRFALLLVTLFQSLNVVQAQSYPVQVNVNTAGPYYNYLSYYADENFHLQAVVTLTDFNSAPVQARLRLKIEGPGYTAITKPGAVVGSTFTLSPGMPEFVKGIDLAPYFYENNLLVTPSGINLNNLPEGFATICVEVINDSPAQEVLSTNNCTSFFLQRFQPSQLVFPACGSSVNPSEQFHTFQWTPPVGFVPSIGTEINYTFSLYEWNDPNNYNIFQTGQGLVYTTQTSNPLVQLSSFDITFQEGLTYVWRIEAQILSNGLEVNMLENNGISSPCTFVYGEVQSLEESLADGLTIDLNTSSEGERKGRAYWTVIDNTPGEGLSTFSSFVVAYRKQPTGNEEFDLTWFEDTVNSFSQFIYQLEPSTTYEVKIAGIAGDFVSDYSEVETFTTNAPRNYACGDQDLPFRPANYTPLENALVGMIFQIGQFDMTITQITPTGSAGHYSGKGMIPVAFLGGARAKVKFDDILVDDQYLVREGQVDVVTKGVENWLSEEYLSMVDPIDVQGQITAYGFANDSTVWAVVNGDTLTWTFQNDLPIVIHGEGNVEIQYWPDGHIVVTTYDTIPSTDSLSATASLNIQFEEVVGQESYFDKKEHDHFAENYEAITCAGNYVYWVPNASRRKTESRQVKAVFHGYDEILDVSKVKFEMNGGYTIAQHTVLNDSTYLVTLPIKDFDYQLYAKYDTLKMGKLNVKSFAQVTKNIKIVPLVPLNYSSTDVSQSLTNLCQGAHVNCVVSIDSLFNTSEFNSSTVFANPEVNGMLHYTEQMRNLREAYFLNHELENDTYLVFVINEFEDASVDGYMVRGKGLGFVTQSSLTTLESFTHTLGHELGHGIGGLVHAWGDAASKKNTTDNLMDYSGGTTLTNNQWQALHNSENVFSLLDSEEDAEMISTVINELEPFKDIENGTYTFIAVNGRFITLPADITKVVFSTLDRYFTQVYHEEVNYYAPIGSLIGFYDSQGRYFISNSYGKFRLYDFTNHITIEDSIYIDKYTSVLTPNKGITTFFQCDAHDLKAAFFQINSPINQSEFQNLNAHSLNRLIIFENENSDRNVALSDFINSSKVSGSQIVLTDLNNLTLGNSEIPIKIEVGTEVLSNYKFLKTLNIFDIIEDESNVTVNLLLSYLSLINAKELDYSAFASCFEENSNEPLEVDETPEFYIVEKATVRDALAIQNYDVQGSNEFVSFNKTYVEKTLVYLLHETYSEITDGRLEEFRALVNQGTTNDLAYFIRGHKCLCFGLSVSDRIKAFHKLIISENSWDVIPMIIDRIPDFLNDYESDFITDFSYLPNGKHWIEIAIDLMNNSSGDDSENLSIMFDIADQLDAIISKNQTHNLVSSTVYTKQLIYSLFPENDGYINYSALSQPIFIIKENKTEVYGYNNNQVKVNFENSNNLWKIEWVNGKVQIRQDYYYCDAFESVSNGDLQSEGWSHNNVNFNLKPYELVQVVFLDNYADELNINKGKTVIVPAFYLLLYKQADINDEFWDQISNIGDAIAVISAPFTLGGSLGWVAASAAVVNVWVNENREFASTEEEAFYQAWDEFYLFLGLVEGVGLVSEIPGQLPQFLIKQEKFYNKLFQLSDNVGTSCQKIKNLILGLPVSGAGDVVRGINKSDFLATVGDFANGAKAQIADQAWTLWKNENWVELENLFNANNLNKYNGLSFPPNNGAVNVIKKTLDPADFNGNLVIDRYGDATGKFTAPANTPFPERALPSSYASQTPQKYKVLQPIPNVEEGQIIPWFSQPGLGIQYKLEKSVQYYIDEGYLLEIP